MTSTGKQADEKQADDKQYRIAQRLARRAHEAGYTGVRCIRDWAAADSASYREAAAEESWVEESWVDENS